jgi:hypothetical protein
MDRFLGKGRGSTNDPNGMVHGGTSIVFFLPREHGRLDGYSLRLHALRPESLKKSPSSSPLLLACPLPASFCVTSSRIPLESYSGRSISRASWRMLEDKLEFRPGFWREEHPCYRCVSYLSTEGPRASFWICMFAERSCRRKWCRVGAPNFMRAHRQTHRHIF